MDQVRFSSFSINCSQLVDDDKEKQTNSYFDKLIYQQQITTKSDGPSAICELNAAMTTSIASTSVLTATDDGIRSLSMMQHRQPMLIGIASNSRSSLFNDAINNQAAAKIQMNLNPRYISKVNYI